MNFMESSRIIKPAREAIDKIIVGIKQVFLAKHLPSDPLNLMIMEKIKRYNRATPIAVL